MASICLFCVVQHNIRMRVVEIMYNTRSHFLYCRIFFQCLLRRKHKFLANIKFFTAYYLKNMSHNNNYYFFLYPPIVKWAFTAKPLIRSERVGSNLVLQYSIPSMYILFVNFRLDGLFTSAQLFVCVVGM